MSKIGVLLLVILCGWTGYSTMTMLYWRKISKEWERLARDAQKLAADVIDQNKSLLSKLERVTEVSDAGSGS